MLMLSAALMNAVGSCTDVDDWSPMGAASSQSALAGVLTGFVFSGLVVVLSVRMANRDKEAASTLKLLFCAFFGLGVAAYLLADVAGDGNCLRSSTEETIAGGMLGTFAIVMIVSLTWLVVAYELHAHDVLRFLRRLIHVATAFVALLLCTSSLSYLQAEVPHGPSFWASAMLFIVGGLFYVAATPAGPGAVNAALKGVKFVLAGVSRLLGQKPASAGPAALASGDPAKQGWWQQIRDPLTGCVWAALGYLGLAAIADAFVLSEPDSAWTHADVFETYVVAWGALIFSLGVLVLAMRAMAPTKEDTAAPAVSQMAIDNGSGAGHKVQT
jgi:predicted membrane channel-forming protein YqfA (hemolysin III family)